VQFFDLLSINYKKLHKKITKTIKNQQMKTTAFTDIHIALGAKMHEFAGYNMPIEYSGISDEHLTVRNGVGVFDVSHMGEFWVKGPHALEFLQKVTTNDVSALTIGKVQYTCFPNGKGGIVDDLLVYYFEKNKYLLVVNASNIEKDWNWCVANNSVGAELENASEWMAQLAVQNDHFAGFDIAHKIGADDIKRAGFAG
jgi:aminomethyltransferase